MTIYIDIILIENIIMNFIILLASNLINRSNINYTRVIIASILGSIYAILEYIYKGNIYSNQLIKFILSVGMVYIAFKASTVKQLAKQLIIFYLTSFTFGGCTYFLIYYIRPSKLLLTSGTYILKLIGLGAILGLIILKLAFNIIKNKTNKNLQISNILVVYKDKKITIKAMLDTGNLLEDPITNTPVIIVQKSELRKIFPKEVFDIKEENIVNYSFENIEYDVRTKIKFIPFKTIGRENGIIIGFKPDYIEINFEDEIIKINNVIIGIYNGILSKKNTYSAIYGLNLINDKKEVKI